MALWPCGFFRLSVGPKPCALYRQILDNLNVDDLAAGEVELCSTPMSFFLGRFTLQKSI
jgi:hypothetical protein